MAPSEMRELTFEVPITEQPVLTEALKHVHVLQVLEFKSRGFSFLCKGSRTESRLLKEALARDRNNRINVAVLNRDRAGTEVLQISGSWSETMRAEKPVRDRTMKFFRQMERAPIYSLGPKFEGNTLRITIMARQSVLRRLLSGLTGVHVRYKILRLTKPKAKNESVLDSLTVRQRSIIGLAHAMGYYDVPRRTRTEDLARLLHLDKGTLGEHLRRAEKHVFDTLMSQ
jgi:hypothetical protein